MTTTHSTAYDAIISRIGTLLSSHKRLPNPYDVSANNSLFLTLGWGLAIGPTAVNTNRFVCSTKSYAVTYVLAITRKMDALSQDAATRASADKALVTDFETILTDAHENNLGAPSGALIKGLGFDGVNSVFTEDNDVYRVLFCNIECEIFKA